MGDRRRKTSLQGKLTSSTTSTGPPEADPDSTESGMTLQLGYFVLTYIRPLPDLLLGLYHLVTVSYLLPAHMAEKFRLCSYGAGQDAASVPVSPANLPSKYVPLTNLLPVSAFDIQFPLFEFQKMCCSQLSAQWQVLQQTARLQ